MSIINMFT